MKRDRSQCGVSAKEKFTLALLYKKRKWGTSSVETFTETHLGRILNAALHVTCLMRKAVNTKAFNRAP